MARPTANLRLFVAAHPPPDFAQHWLDLLPRLNLPQHRPTPVQQVHLTLLFIGDTPVRKMDATIESVERSCAGIGGFDLVPRRLIALPDEGPSRPARLIAMESDSPGSLMELQRRLAARLARKPREKSKKAFRPHFTLCRFASPTSLDFESPSVPHQVVPVRHIQLMRSTLSHDGAQHHVVQSFPLDD